jgi:DNA-3-methyladenine glycosylase I
VIRSRAKIQAAIRGARIWLDMRDSGEDFSAWIWSFVDGKPVQDSQPGLTQSAASLALSNALKRRGFSFCGPVITYAFMQACGLVNDHTISCFRCNEVRAMGTSRKVIVEI